MVDIPRDNDPGAHGDSLWGTGCTASITPSSLPSQTSKDVASQLRGKGIRGSLLADPRVLFLEGTWKQRERALLYWIKPLRFLQH